MRHAIARMGVPLALLGLTIGRAAAEPALLTADELAAFEQRGLATRDPEHVRRVLGPYSARISGEGVDIGAIVVVGVEGMECVLARAEERSASILSVFTEDPFLRGRGRAVLIERATLAHLARAFEFHTAFPVAGQLRDGEVTAMQFLLVGQGRLMMVYDHGGTYDHPDPAYGVKLLVKTLRGYDIGRYVRMEIARDGDGHRLLRDLEIADGPEARLRPFRGPGDLQVRQLIVDGAGMKVVTAFKNVDLGRVAVTDRLPDPDRLARLATRGCPSRGPWTLWPPSPGYRWNP